MTEKFVEFTLPCHECIVQASCQSKSKVKLFEDGTDDLNKNLKLSDLYFSVLAIPKFDERKKCWKKGMLEMWINMGYGLAVKHGLKRSDYKGYGDKGPAFADFINELAQMLTYIIHSTSWEEGEEKPFDIDELKRKLNTAKCFLR